MGKGRTDNPHISHNFISSYHPLPVCCLTPTTPVSSMSSLGVHRLSVSPQRPFSSPASLQKQSDPGLACNSKWSSTAGVPRALPEPSLPSASASKQLICLLKGITAWGTALQRHSLSLYFGWYPWFRPFWVSTEFWVCPATTHFFEHTNISFHSPEHSVFI